MYRRRKQFVNAVKQLNQGRNNMQHSSISGTGLDLVELTEIESCLEEDLLKDLAALDILRDERMLIEDPEALGTTILNVIFEQVNNQIALVAGNDFIRANNGLRLDLHDDKHIQTTENFVVGVLATHNDEINYIARYEEYTSHFEHDPNLPKYHSGVKVSGSESLDRYQFDSSEQSWTQYDNRSQTHRKIVRKDARAAFDKDRPKGDRHNHYDHVVSVAELLRDPTLYAHVDKEQIVAFANSEENLNLMPGDANQSKRDSSMSEFLDSTDKTGKKPAERFDINESELRSKDRRAREKLDNIKHQGEAKSVEAGRASQRREAVRIGWHALRGAALGMLMDLVKEIIGRLVIWFKSTQKSLKSFAESVKCAIISFVNRLKEVVGNACLSAATVVADAIIGPVVNTLTRVWILLKEGWKSLSEAIAYLRNPANRDVSAAMKFFEVGKIVTAGLSGAGAIVLGEVIEKALLAFPPFAVEIPLLGSLANITGVFLGATVAGVTGAIIIRWLNIAAANQKRRELAHEENTLSSEMLRKQTLQMQIAAEKTGIIGSTTATSIKARHKNATSIIADSVRKVFSDDDSPVKPMRFDSLDLKLAALRNN